MRVNVNGSRSIYATPLSRGLLYIDTIANWCLEKTGLQSPREAGQAAS
ncbi:MAG: hypothetical protein VB140_10135 [Burkholderia sp.]